MEPSSSQSRSSSRELAPSVHSAGSSPACESCVMTTHHPASQIRRVAPRDLISDADMRDNSLLRMDGTLTREPRGGLEMLFSDQRHHSVTLPSEARNGHAADIAFLIDHLCDHVMKDTRKELFVLDGHMYVRICPVEHAIGSPPWSTDAALFPDLRPCVPVTTNHRP